MPTKNENDPLSIIIYEYWSRKNKESLGYMILNMSPEIAVIYKGIKNARETWNSLKERFEGETEDKEIQDKPFLTLKRNMTLKATMPLKHKRKRTINVAENERRIKSLAKGTVRMKHMIQNEEENNIKLEVLFVPDLRTNLLSVPKIVQKGNEVTFNVKGAFIHSKEEKLHIDLCGPMKISTLGGSKYMLTVVDQYTRLFFIEFLRAKDETATRLKRLITRRENETDNGGEFINEDLYQFLTEKGIKHELTTPYSPRNANLPLKLWGEAANTAAYIHNLTPTKPKERKTPMELWTGRKPSVRHSNTFGCQAYYKIFHPKRHYIF
ncbi:hypothetical protein LAZ67_13000260 [Cordylochernes scorpioides]|uniref:Integrase catalytic domain-containing protein n=1 Tax=Cordylochernes scorpioides TaxID=51811 RepID=A0ABY6L7L5_9ARAC|nr:hypothetical protein LAZ67_13000260 [Cordylochernes scorpioides]